MIDLPPARRRRSDHGSRPRPPCRSRCSAALPRSRRIASPAPRAGRPRSRMYPPSTLSGSTTSSAPAARACASSRAIRARPSSTSRPNGAATAAITGMPSLSARGPRPGMDRGPTPMLGRWPRLVSVNVGRPQQLSVRRGRPLMSAIGKAPVEGRVRVAGVNVEGDDQADRRVHGGPDKAVYAYAAEDTAFWEGELGRELGAGRVRREPHDRGPRRQRRGRRRALADRRPSSSRSASRGCRAPSSRCGWASRRWSSASRRPRGPGAYLRIVGEGSLGAGDAIEVRLAARARRHRARRQRRDPARRGAAGARGLGARAAGRPGGVDARARRVANVNGGWVGRVRGGPGVEGRLVRDSG